jgi:3-methylfumaryl-CoA hydratase
MWAGGKIDWPREGDLHTMNETSERMELLDVQGKKRSGGGELIVMSISKVLKQNGSEKVRETRQWVFLKEGEASAAEAKKITNVRPVEETLFRRTVQFSWVTLFRYSALIFNSHAIHLSREHCLKEGHPDLVVHGPLTFSLLLEAVRGRLPDARWKSVTYRAEGPAYVCDPVTLNVGVERDRKVAAWADKGDGIPVMKVSIELW